MFIQTLLERWVHSGHRFVQHDQTRVSHQCAGHLKKLSLAAALIHRPSLLFLDEPFEGVDAVASRTIRELLLQFTASGGTVFLTSHVLEVVERLCTHVGIIVSGQLVAQSSLEDLVAGGRLETAFIKATGAEVLEEVSAKLDWLTSEKGA